MMSLGLMEWTSRWLRVWRKDGRGDWFAEVLQDQASTLPLIVHCQRNRSAAWLAGLLGIGSRWQVGWPAWKMYFLKPAEVLTDFLPHWHLAKSWRIGTTTISTQQLLRLILAQLAPVLQSTKTWSLLLPSYCEEQQLTDFLRQLRQAGLKADAVLAQDLALACAAWQQHGPWTAALLADLDDHALVVTQTIWNEPNLLISRRHVFPELGLRIWITRLVQACADLSVRQTRQDPRLSREASQLLYLQLTAALSRLQNEPLSLHVHVPDFHAELVLTPDLAKQACLPLAQMSARIIRELYVPNTEVFLSQRFAELPDVIRVVYQALGHRLPIFVMEQTPYLESAAQLTLTSSSEAVPAEQMPALLWRHARSIHDWAETS
ncbi:MAG: hypothetical protein RMJ19_06780 [Gemmatales bacterium]|nr:hypothetical protein [Gemmatales bacterium]MDW8175359.1 hypothetical protein [Gemmatales bacterium]